MKKTFFATLLFLIVIGSSAFTAHKFYVSIYQVNYAQEKKMLQITSRIFIDDINNALEKKYNRKFHLGEIDETPDDVVKMQNYLADNFLIKINGKSKALEFRSKEMENNVLICYFRITEVSKISALEITNKTLFDFVTEQQNIIQTTIYGQKTSLLLTADNPKGILKF